MALVTHPAANDTASGPSTAALADATAALADATATSGSSTSTLPDGTSSSPSATARSHASRARDPSTTARSDASGTGASTSAVLPSRPPKDVGRLTPHLTRREEGVDRSNWRENGTQGGVRRESKSAQGRLVCRHHRVPIYSVGSSTDGVTDFGGHRPSRVKARPTSHDAHRRRAPHWARRGHGLQGNLGGPDLDGALGSVSDCKRCRHSKHGQLTRVRAPCPWIAPRIAPRPAPSRVQPRPPRPPPPDWLAASVLLLLLLLLDGILLLLLLLLLWLLLLLLL